MRYNWFSKKGKIVLICIITAIILFVVWLYWDNYREVRKYQTISEETYLALQSDTHYQGYRIIVNGKIVLKYPEYWSDGVESFSIDERAGNIYITTK